MVKTAESIAQAEAEAKKPTVNELIETLIEVQIQTLLEVRSLAGTTAAVALSRVGRHASALDNVRYGPALERMTRALLPAEGPPPTEEAVAAAESAGEDDDDEGGGDRTEEEAA